MSVQYISFLQVCMWSIQRRDGFEMALRKVFTTWINVTSCDTIRMCGATNSCLSMKLYLLKMNVLASTIVESCIQICKSKNDFTNFADNWHSLQGVSIHSYILQVFRVRELNRDNAAHDATVITHRCWIDNCRLSYPSRMTFTITSKMHYIG